MKQIESQVVRINTTNLLDKDEMLWTVLEECTRRNLNTKSVSLIVFNGKCLEFCWKMNLKTLELEIIGLQKNWS